MLWLFLRKNLNWLLLVAFLVMTIQPNRALAADPDTLKDVLSDSQPAATAVHDIFLDISASTTFASGETITVTFPGGFTGVSGITASDITLFKDGASSKTVQSGACGATDTVRFTVASQTITFTACSSYSGTTGSIIQMTIGGTNKITNPSASTPQITVAGNYGDNSKDTVVAIITGVTVSATVDESLSFTLAQGAACAGDTGSPTSVNGSVTATAVPFGTITPDTFKVGCQDLTLSTNALNGYAITSQEGTNLRTSGGTNLPDTTCDSACSESAGTAWATATANQGLGYFCEDVTSTPCDTAGNSTSKYRQFACLGTNAECDPGSGAETARNVMIKTGPVSGDIGRVHYKLSVSNVQATGVYSNTVVYIATPTF